MKKRSFLKGLIIFAVVVVGLLIRFYYRDVVSGDYVLYNKKWFDAIVEHGRFAGISEKVGNYSIANEILFTLLTYFSISPLYSIKILVVLFDISLAFGCMKIIELMSDNKYSPMIIFAVVFLCPTVFINSSAWGQFDAIYVSFMVWSFYFMLKERYVTMMMFFGISMIFKMQAIFYLPFLLLLYFVLKEYTIFFYAIPIGIFAFTEVLGTILGRPLGTEFFNCVTNTSKYGYIYMNYPSFYALIQQWERIIPAVSAMASFVFLAAMLMVMRLFMNRENFSREQLLYAAMITTYTAVFFLPSMHERYGYAYEIFALLYMMCNKKAIPFAIGLIAISTITYSFFLGWINYNTFYLGLCNLICYVGLLVLGIKEYGLLNTNNNYLEVD